MLSRLFRRAPKQKMPCTPADIPGRPGLVRLEVAAKQALDLSRGRLVIGISLFSLAFCLLAGRLVELTAFHGAVEPVVARVNPDITARTVLMDRHPIFDRNRGILAANLTLASL